MEKYLASSTVQISAAAFLAIIVGIFVGQISQRSGNPATDETVVSDNSPLPGVNPAVVANTGPVSSTLPTEPDAANRAANWLNSDTNEHMPSPDVKGGKFANIFPDKMPPRPHPAKRAPAERPAHTNPAHTASDQTTLHVRQLQTQLMVGALSCGQPRMTASYNSFVAKFSHALKVNGNALKSYFTRMFGSRGVSEMDSFLTKLSNEISLVSMRHSDFCSRTDGLFNTVLALGPNEIEAFADHYLSQPMVARDGF